MKKKAKDCGCFRFFVYASARLNYGFSFVLDGKILFDDTTEIFRKPMQWMPKIAQWKNYADIMTMRPFARWMCNSAFIVFFNVIGTMLTSSMAAFAFARINFRGKNVVFAMVMAAMMIPSATLLIPQFMIWKALKGIDTYAAFDFRSIWCARILYFYVKTIL